MPDSSNNPNTRVGAMAPDASTSPVGHTPGEWIVPKSVADMPVKPGVERYEYVDCLVLYRGNILMRPWNCEHQVFDDEHQDDFFCEWDDVSAYRSLAGEGAAARAAIAKARGEQA